MRKLSYLLFIITLLFGSIGYTMSLSDANAILTEADSALVYRVHFIYVGGANDGVADYFPASGETALSLSDAKEKFNTFSEKNYGRYSNITIKHD